MTTLVFDDTFEGLMTAVFEVFEYRFEPAEIVSQQHHFNEALFADVHHVVSDAAKADRVIKKLEKSLGKNGVKQMLLVYLSERADVANLILFRSSPGCSESG